ncbi:MAG: putative Mg2+ and Co2+ transporter [Pseudomonadota bacterium]|jgi:Mg2+ and Co2+ transporter CorA
MSTLPAAAPMRIIEFSEGTLRFLDEVPAQAPDTGFLWVSLARDQLQPQLARLQEAAQRIGGSPLLDLHVKDLDNLLHPSSYDFTSIYDVVIFRRLSTPGEVEAEMGPAPAASARGGPKALATFRRIRTQAMGFVVFDRLLVTVHPPQCPMVRTLVERYAREVLQNGGAQAPARSRLPSSPPDLMLRMVDTMVDAYLDLRRQLTTELTTWQERLLRPSVGSADWSAVMLARAQLHSLEDMCEEQSDAMQEWLDTTRDQPPPMLSMAERDLLVARANDVIEHIQRVITQVRRMEQGAEAAVQIHFSAQSHRTNAVMRRLTAITAIFLPLNLVTGIFGMNFDVMPLLHQASGFWITIGAMAVLAGALGLVFWRKRYLARSGR